METITASYDRLNDASTSTTGALDSSIARTSYMAEWFDGIDRPIDSANYGEDGKRVTTDSLTCFAAQDMFE
jgi:hypothetical protein